MGLARVRAGVRARLAGFDMKPVRVLFQTYTGFISNPYGFQTDPVRILKMWSVECGAWSDSPSEGQRYSVFRHHGIPVYRHLVMSKLRNVEISKFR